MKQLYLATLLLLFTCCILNAQDQSSYYKKEHEFDFWIGEWNVYKFGTDSIIGVSSIKPILNHKTIEENYQSLLQKYQGKSYNIYDRHTNQWLQFWVDNTGSSLHIKGEYKENEMSLSDCENKNPCNRITWLQLKDLTVRQIWEQTNDKGKTWKRVFDGHYKPRK